jgi:hypothetical protein
MITYQRLSRIIPPDQALANKALATSLQQISGIVNMTLPVLATAVVPLQTTNNLPLITALPEPVPVSVANYLANIAGTSGEPIAVCDVLGTAAGYNITDNMSNTVSTLANITVSYLTSIYQTMDSVVGNVYGDPINGPVTIPSGQPAAGTYYANIGNVGNVSNVVLSSAADSAFTGAGGDLPPTGPGLIPVAVTEIGNITVAFANLTADLNSYFNSMAQQISQENTLQTTIPIDFANLLPDNNNSIYSLVFSLPTYGQQSEQGGPAQFWEGVANLANFTGQAVVAVLREGHNKFYLDGAGIATNSAIPADAVPPTPQANLIPSTYSAQEAANLIVR